MRTGTSPPTPWRRSATPYACSCSARSCGGGVRSVTELGNSEGLGTSGQLYHHLRQLVSAGWLRTAGRGRYEVPVARIVPLLVIVTAAQR